MQPETLEKSSLLTLHPWMSIHTWQYITGGYRLPTGDQTLNSLWYFHNEWGNVWTHVFGMLWVLYLTWMTREHFVDKTCQGPQKLMEMFGFAFYHLCFFVCFGISSMYHLYCSHSLLVCQKWQSYDWMAVGMLVFATNLLGGIFELFSVSPLLFSVYVCANVGCLLCCQYLTYTSLLNMFDERHTPTTTTSSSSSSSSIFSSYLFRILVYVVFAFGLIIAFLLRCLVEPDYMETNTSLEGIAQMYAAYSTVFLCILHFPERLFSSYSCFIFSHSLFHVGSILGYHILFFTYFKKE